MAVTKRLRFEVLRRDNHTCRYCGAAAPDVELHVDHVVPGALGGSDDPSNLVASCRDCNSGKASTSPDETTVEDVSADAIRWSKAIQSAADIQRAEAWNLSVFADAIDTALEDAFVGGYIGPEFSKDGWHYSSAPHRTYDWAAILYGPNDKRLEIIKLFDTEEEAYRGADEETEKRRIPMPEDWDVSAAVWKAAGITEEDLNRAARVTKKATHVGLDHKFRYFCGVIWRTIEERHAIAKELLAVEAGQTSEVDL